VWAPTFWWIILMSPFSLSWLKIMVISEPLLKYYYWTMLWLYYNYLQFHKDTYSSTIISSSYMLHFEWLKCYGNVYSSSKNHLWSAKEKEKWKITRKINFPTYRTHIYLFGPLLLSNLITFLFLIHFKLFKIL